MRMISVAVEEVVAGKVVRVKTVLSWLEYLENRGHVPLLDLIARRLNWKLTKEINKKTK